ncbi:MAG: hypothetical protein RLZZ618_3848 [Pseudomonadota bacterium]|jgi:hypothetical protein
MSMNSESPLPEAVEPADVPAAVPDEEPAAPSAASAAEPAIDCAAVLKQLFPKVFGAKAQPLKLGIQADIQARSPGTFSKKALSTFLRRHTANHAYLIAITKSQHRFDLDGEPSGDISAEHREAAQAELTRRRGNREARLVAEQDAKRQRASLLRDFSQTTLTPANFCALRGIAAGDLDGLLAVAREEAANEPAPPVRRPEPRRPDTRGRPAQADRGRGPKPR